MTRYCIIGAGASGLVEGGRVYVGSVELFESLGAQLNGAGALVDAYREQGKTTVLVGSASVALGLIAVRDENRAEARDAVQGLHAAGIKADAIKLPLRADYRQDIPLMVRTTRKNYRDIGFVYLCNPNNPTGIVVSKQEVRELLDGIPEDMPVLIDEAYHHFIEEPSYESSVPYVLEGRPVVVARNFSKIVELAGMRLG